MPAWKEAAFAGQQVRKKVVLALLFSSLVPLLVLIYVLHGYIVPLLGQHRPIVLALQILILFTGLLMVAGAYVIWDLANAVVRAARLAGASRVVPGPDERTDEVGSLVTSVSNMVGTIEKQARDINQLSGRLEIKFNSSSKTSRLVKVVPQYSGDLRVWTNLPETNLTSGQDGSTTANIPMSGPPGFLRLAVVLISPE